MATPPRTSTQTGAVTAGHDRKGRGGAGWLKWLLLALLLVGLAILLISLLSGGDDKKASAGKTDAKPTATPPAAQAGTATPSSGSSTGGASAAPLSANGRALHGDAPKALAASVGQRAIGRGAVVQSVVKDSGFWVGTSRADRVFIEYGDKLGPDEEKRFRARVGEKVDLRGPVRPAPSDPVKRLGLSASDARELRRQGAFINANRVEHR